MTWGSARMIRRKALSCFEEKSGALKVQRGKKLISVLRIFLCPSSPHPPHFSNFPEDGGACLPGT